MAWTYYRSIAANANKVSGSLSDFPMLVSGAFSYLASASAGGKVQNANGYDIAFFSDSALATQLSHEVELYNSASGDFVAWCKLPTLTSASATTVYIAYGNQTVTASLANATNVWDSHYKAVYHLGNGSTLSLADSTANNHSGTNNGATAASGKIRGGASVNGTNYISLGDHNDFTPSAANGFTLSLWFYRNAATGQFALFDKYEDTGADYEYVAGFIDGSLYFWIYDEVSSNYRGRTYSNALNGAFHLAHFVWDGADGGADNFRIYIDGQQVDNGNFEGGFPTQVSNTPQPLSLGRTNDGMGGGGSGTIDEFRWAGTTRTPAWIATEYNNQSDPATFYTIGSEVVIGGGGAVAPSAYWVTTTANWLWFQ
jgi:hypothetical protein